MALAAFGCGRDKDDGDGPALSFGTYDLSAPVCVSTGVAPLYPDVAHKAALFDFANLTEHTLVVQAQTSIEKIADADCTATVTRGVFANEGASFSLRKNRSNAFVPESCSLTVQVKDVILAVGKANGAPFVDQAELTEEVPYDVTPVAGGYDLTTRDLVGLSDLWAAYGCAQPDRLRIHLNGPK